MSARLVAAGPCGEQMGDRPDASRRPLGPRVQRVRDPLLAGDARSSCRSISSGGPAALLSTNHARLLKGWTWDQALEDGPAPATAEKFDGQAWGAVHRNPHGGIRSKVSFPAAAPAARSAGRESVGGGATTPLGDRTG